MSSLPWAELGGPGGFRCDSRFAPPQPAPPPVEAEPTEPADPVALAWDQGYLAGLTEARAEAEREAQEADAARRQWQVTLGRLDAQMQEELRERLLTTVTALCEAALAPLALDQDALLRRVERACAMLSRADDEKVLRLHPDDLALIGKLLPQDVETKPDSSLERGSLRVETTSGGVEDGPDTWRRALAEALAQC